jgi:hypothetical protein
MSGSLGDQRALPSDHWVEEPVRLHCARASVPVPKLGDEGVVGHSFRDMERSSSQ